MFAVSTDWLDMTDRYLAEDSHQVAFQIPNVVYMIVNNTSKKRK